MYTVVDLIDCVNRDDAASFLLVYLNLIEQKASLRLPISTEFDLCKAQWRDVFPPKCAHATEGFVAKLAQLWIDIVDSHGGSVTDYYVRELITLLQVKNKNNPLDNIDGEGSPLVGMDATLLDVTPSISKRYSFEKEVRSDLERPVKKQFEKCKGYLITEQVDQFLLAYLELVINDYSYKLPATTIQESIETKWMTIIKQFFKMDVEVGFITQLSHHWFSLVNRKGIPGSREHVIDLLVLYKSLFNVMERPYNEEPVKKKSFFQGLFGFFSG